MNVEFSTVSSPLGELTAFVGPQGVLTVELVSREGGIEELREALGDDLVLRERKRLDAARELREYLAGERRSFDVAVDLRLVRSDFQRRVLGELLKIPFGKTVTYGELAARAGRPGGARAVGGAVGKNPIPVIVPCHRVVASGGKLGGFSSGLSRKRWLHEHEGIDELPGGWRAKREISRGLS